MNTHTFALSMALGLAAGLGDILGGLLLVRRNPSPHALRSFVAFGAGFMLAAVLLEMIPEALRLRPSAAPALILLGYAIVHLLEHTLMPHIHFGEPAHAGEIPRHTRTAVLLALAAHTFFDGVAIGSGFALSSWLGWIVFLAVLLHKLPEGFTIVSVMLAAGESRGSALNAAIFLGFTTILGVLIIDLVPQLATGGLPLAAGVTLYVAATDLLPEINRQPSTRSALMTLGGIALFFGLRLLLPA